MQHAEHRIPLAKFIWLGILKLTNYDFRAGNFLVVLAFGAVAGGMILAARAVRGTTSYADAFLPLSVSQPVAVDGLPVVVLQSTTSCRRCWRVPL